MSSSGSTRELSKAISSFIPSASLPLPDDLIEVIEAYLEKHADEAPSERLQEELVSIWEKSVAEIPSAHASWLAILRRLLPALKNSDWLVEWWDRIQEPVLDRLEEDKSLASEAWANTLAVLTSDDIEQDGEGIGQLVARLLRIWMQTAQLASQDGSSSVLLKAKLIRGSLLSYGKKRPKGLFSALNSFVMRKEHRAQALSLLCEFVQSQPPHLHVVLETPLFDNILRCLQEDTSTLVVTLAVTALTMLLPNVPSSLVPYLPKLFNIYARLLFWDRERSLAPENPDMELDGDIFRLQSDWDRCVISPDSDTTSIPSLLSYFTILYGLYPLNFVDYIRKPQRYLRHADDPNADTIEIQPSEIRQKSERFRQYHILHPNFYNFTVESEKSDLGRWIKSEASEVVAECTALCLAADYGSGPEPAMPQNVGLAELDDTGRTGLSRPLLPGQAILDGSSSHDQSWRSSTAAGSSEDARTQAAVLRRQSQSSHAPSLREAFQTRHPAPGDSPTLPASLVLSPSNTNLQDMINSNKVIKSVGLHQSLANDSVPSLALSHQESIPEKMSNRPATTSLAPAASPTGVENRNEQLSQLYKKILLLSNDLAFERYMRQQHMAHIGELKRRQLKEAATEAETQNLILINRNLRNRLEEAKRSELRAKKESDNRRNLSKKWETDLSNKLRLLKEEQKKWNSEGSALKRELDAKTQECEKLTKMLCEFETTELNSKQNLQAVNDHVEEIARLKAEVNRFVELEATYQEKEKEAEDRLAEAAESVSRAEIMGMKLTARDAEMVEARKTYETQIAELNEKLQDALQNGATRRTRESEPGAIVESTLAASRSKMHDLQRQYDILVRKYSTLQSSLLDIKAQAIPITRSGLTSDSSDAEISAIVQGGGPPSPVRKRSTRGRGFSDPEAFVEGTKYNVTPPLEALAGSSAGTVIQRPSTPMSGVAESSSTTEKSPTERYYGRGGVQNSGRKDKKEKKSSGIRSIRGFV